MENKAHDKLPAGFQITAFARDVPNASSMALGMKGTLNRSSKIGYRIMVVRLENNRPVSYEVFAQGWLQGEDDWGRPVDVR